MDINNLKVGDLIPIGGSGNVTANEVLEGKTFSSDDGTDLKGTMKNNGNKIITPSKNIQTLGNGFYNSIKINPIDNNVLQGNFPELKPENIRYGINIGGITGNVYEYKIFHGYITRENGEIVVSSNTNTESYNYNGNIFNFYTKNKPIFIYFIGLGTGIIGGTSLQRNEYGFIYNSLDGRVRNKYFYKRSDDNYYVEFPNNTTNIGFDVSINYYGFRIMFNESNRHITNTEDIQWFIIA